MGVISILAAAGGAYAFGAIWYMSLSRQWLAVSGIPLTRDGKPSIKGNALPFVISAFAMIIVAGMMRHIFGTSGIEAPAAGLVAGFGLGTFISLPWIVTNYAYAMRPFALVAIDGGYAVIGSSIMGLILTLI